MQRFLAQLSSLRSGDGRRNVRRQQWMHSRIASGFPVHHRWRMRARRRTSLSLRRLLRPHLSSVIGSGPGRTSRLSGRMRPASRSYPVTSLLLLTGLSLTRRHNAWTMASFRFRSARASLQQSRSANLAPSFQEQSPDGSLTQISRLPTLRGWLRKTSPWLHSSCMLMRQKPTPEIHAIGLPVNVCFGLIPASSFIVTKVWSGSRAPSSRLGSERQLRPTAPDIAGSSASQWGLSAALVTLAKHDANA